MGEDRRDAGNSGPSYGFRPKGLVLTVPEQIADRICELILNGDYRPGERIMEVALAETFGVSRGPVREALRLLESDGLVMLSPRRGAQVTELSPEEVENLFEIRAALSSLAAQHAATRITEREVSDLRQVVEAMHRAAHEDDNVQAYVALGAQAGQIIVTGSRNPRLTSMLQSLSRQTLRYAQLGLSTCERRQESAEFWKRLADALGRGDSTTAGEMNAEMIHRSKEAALELLTNEL